MENEKIWLAQFVAKSASISRRMAIEAIKSGRISVGGVKITNPIFTIDTSDIAYLDHQQLKLQEAEIWLYNKPRGVITSHKDTRGRTTLFSLLPPDMRRFLSVGRLDYNSEGLIILTNDGRIAHQWETSADIRKYKVRAFGVLTEDIIDKIEKGVIIDNFHYKPIKINMDTKIVNDIPRNYWFIMSLTEGKNREIRKILEYFGLEVSRLIRISYGPFELGELKTGDLKRVVDKEPGHAGLRSGIF